jgi:hypothetical protein
MSGKEVTRDLKGSQESEGEREIQEKSQKYSIKILKLFTHLTTPRPFVNYFLDPFIPCILLYLLN